MTDLLAFLDAQWSWYLGCPRGQLHDGHKHVVARPQAASEKGSPWPLRRGPVVLFTTGHGWVMSLPEQLLGAARTSCLDLGFEELVREGDHLSQEWFDHPEMHFDRGAAGYRTMNRVAAPLKLRGWSHYVFWYCDPATWRPRPDEHVRLITEHDADIWQQWLAWPGPMVGPHIRDQFEITDAFGYVLEGRLVSAAQIEASPEDFAWEYGVDTLADFRGRGFATAVLNSVTTHIVAQGRVPWHYYNHYNRASARLPAKVGYFHYAEGLFGML